MPTYDYECSSCGCKFELFQNMNDKPVRKCPECGGNAAKRLLGAGAAVIFKGKGFYATDYKKSSCSGCPSVSGKPASGKSAEPCAGGGDCPAAERSDD